LALQSFYNCTGVFSPGEIEYCRIVSHNKMSKLWKPTLRTGRDKRGVRTSSNYIQMRLSNRPDNLCGGRAKTGSLKQLRLDKHKHPSMESAPELKFEIGHVLYIDIVGYSKLNIHEQSEQLETLKTIVRGAEQFKKAEAEGKLLRLPTGDGGALVFRTTPEAPVLCALEISRALKSHPDLKIRMGIHSGPVNEISDLNEQANIAGAGINTPQRVMDCGDAGHILLSKHVADDPEHYPRWKPYLHSLGECEVKHGARIDIVNLHNDEVGNPSAPKKWQAVHQRRARTRWAAVVSALLLLCAIVAALVIVSKKSATSTSVIPKKSIAVLLFENLSDDKSNAYFAEGIQDEILTKLASIADLKVISRTSTAKYKSKPDDLKIVSQQLGVANVVEGTVQRAADKVRVNVQLIDARADSHLWAKSYDREIKDVFAVESEVSQEIAEALQARLSPNEANTLATAPTKDPEAYDFFLKGEYEEREALTSRRLETFEKAAGFYQEAIARDSRFALAMASLAENEIWRHWWLKPLSDADLDKVRSRAEQALSLSPNLAQGHIALGLYYSYGTLQFDQALAEFRRALELQPNNVRALEHSANVHRRQGQWARHLSELTRCEQLDPRDAQIPVLIGATYCRLRMWEEANRAGQRALALDPRNMPAIVDVLLYYYEETGEIEKAIQLLNASPADLFVAQSFKRGGDVSNVIGRWPYFYVIKRDYTSALKAWEKPSAEAPVNLLSARAAIFVLAGNTSSAAKEIENALNLVEARLREHPDDRNALSQLSWIYLGLQRNSEAIKVAQRLAELISPEKDALEGPETLANLAEIQARAGDASAAVKTLRQVLQLPAGMVASIQRLKIDPVWDPIRNDLGFQQLLAEGKELVGLPK
jgi:TolB-like protein/class 3 adenylate cyclase